MDLLTDIPMRELARATDPVTSHAAAARVSEFAAEHYVRILRALDSGPAHIYAIAERAGLNHVQVARRITELANGHRVVTVGQPIRGPTGRKCRVWAKGPRT